MHIFILHNIWGITIFSELQILSKLVRFLTFLNLELNVSNFFSGCFFVLLCFVFPVRFGHTPLSWETVLRTKRFHWDPGGGAALPGSHSCLCGWSHLGYFALGKFSLLPSFLSASARHMRKERRYGGVGVGVCGVCIFNPGTQEADGGRSLWMWPQLGLHGEFQGSQDYRETLSK